MAIRHIPFDELGPQHIQQLIEDKVEERKHLEYKRDLNLKLDSEKKELCADISSFANVDGGDIIYGIEAKDGIPTSITGLKEVNPDQTILQIENIIKDGIEPRIRVIQSKKITMDSGEVLLLLRIGRSWAVPHMVKDGRFWARASNGKYYLDRQQVGAAFAATAELPRRIQAFRDERLGRIIANQGAMPMPDDPKLIMHFIPISAFEGTICLDPLVIEQESREIKLDRWVPGGSRLNLNGFLRYASPLRDRHTSAYIQFFRNGAIEIVDTESCGVEEPSQQKGMQICRGDIVERFIDNMTSQSLSFLKAVQIEPPLFLFVALIGMRGVTVISGGPLGYSQQAFYQRSDHCIDDDPLLLPEIQIDDFNADPQTLLLPTFEILWQASGMIRPKPNI